MSKFRDLPRYKVRYYVEIMCTVTGKTPLAMKTWLKRRGMAYDDPDSVITVVLNNYDKINDQPPSWRLPGSDEDTPGK